MAARTVLEDETLVAVSAFDPPAFFGDLKPDAGMGHPAIAGHAGAFDIFGLGGVIDPGGRKIALVVDRLFGHLKKSLISCPVSGWV